MLTTDNHEYGQPLSITESDVMELERKDERLLKEYYAGDYFLREDWDHFSKRKYMEEAIKDGKARLNAFFENIAKKLNNR